MAAVVSGKVLTLLALFSVSCHVCAVEDLCNLSHCSCNNLASDLIQVNCQCAANDQVLSIGPAEEDGSSMGFAPGQSVTLSVSGCQQLEIMPKTLNGLANLQNVSIKDVHTVILHSRLYEARVGNGQFTTINDFELENVQDLVVKRHTFEGVRIQGTFLLKSVIVGRTPSLAFAFDSVNEFNIMSSRFDRVSMWGFKLEDCNEFNALEDSRFYSLASQAFHMKCNKFMLAYNTFDNLQDASLGVTYGVADIQGNTFEKLTGKPFVDMRPLIESQPSESHQSGLLFRENKFACEPMLPFNALAMPSYDAINVPQAYVVIENNHFTCQCDKMAWFLGAMTHNFDRDVIANGRGSLEFLQKLYDTAGNCLTCGLRRCDETSQRFHDFASNALMQHKGQLKCTSSGQPLKSQHPDRSGLEATSGSTGEEEGLADSRNMELLNSSMTHLSHVWFSVLGIICLRLLV